MPYCVEISIKFKLIKHKNYEHYNQRQQTRNTIRKSIRCRNTSKNANCITPLYVPADELGTDCYIPNTNYQRGLEIRQFLEHNPCESYVIIDDNDEFMPEQQCRFVKCDSRKGFDAERLSFAVGLV